MHFRQHEASVLPAEIDEASDDVFRDEIAATLRGLGLTAANAGKAADALVRLNPARPSAHQADNNAGDILLRVEATIREMLRSVTRSDRPKLQARLLLIARGSDMDPGESLRRIAGEYGLSPEGVSKMVDGMRAQFALPKNDFNKSASACARYRTTNRENNRKL